MFKYEVHLKIITKKKIIMIITMKINKIVFILSTVIQLILKEILEAIKMLLNNKETSHI